MSVILIASVPHTGSQFVLKLLCYPIRDRSQGETVQHLRHVYEDESLELIAGHKGTIVVPLRHPKACAQSWANRGKPIVSHPKHAPMVKLWRNLIDVVDKLNPWYLPLDVDNRAVYLDKLSRHLGKPLTTDWAKVSHHPGNAELTDEDNEAVDELLTDPFFARFYA